MKTDDEIRQFFLHHVEELEWTFDMNSVEKFIKFLHGEFDNKEVKPYGVVKCPINGCQEEFRFDVEVERANYFMPLREKIERHLVGHKFRDTIKHISMGIIQRIREVN